ncbi:pneumococcal serine-rich repeat protein-like [Ptychodera flava]|uniref:pneumococcal serine-rich repeat protein-like n=1 Tax=Ptychodera flava TaxID=63121 RepID=UPI00396AA0FE
MSETLKSTGAKGSTPSLSHGTVTTDRLGVTTKQRYPTQSVTGTTVLTESSSVETSAATPSTTKSAFTESKTSKEEKVSETASSHDTATTDRPRATKMHSYPAQSVTGTTTTSTQSSSMETSAATSPTASSAFTESIASKEETVSVTASSHDTVTTDRPSVTTMHRYPTQSVTGTRTISMESSSVETSTATPSTRKSAFTESKTSKEEKVSVTASSHDTVKTDRPSVTTMHSYPAQSVTGTTTTSIQSSVMETSQATSSTATSAFTGAKASKKETVSVTASSHDTVTTDSPSVTTMHRYPSQSVTGTRTISMESSSVETSTATPSTRKSAFTESKTSKEEKVSVTASSHDTVKTDRPSVTTMHSYPAQSVTGTTTTSIQSSVMETSQATSSTATSEMSELPKSTRVKGRTHPVSHGTSTTDRLGETTMHHYPTQSVTGTRTISMQSSSVDTSAATPSTTESAFTGAKASKKETVSVTASSHDTVTTDRPSVTTVHRYPSQSVTGTRTISMESSSVESSAATPSTRKSAFTESKTSKEEKVSVTASSHDTVKTDRPSVTTMHSYPAQSVTGTTTTSIQSSVMETSQATSSTATSGMPELPKSTRVQGGTPSLSHGTVTADKLGVTTKQRYPTQSVTGTTTVSTQSSSVETSATPSSTKSAFTESKTSKEEKVSETASSHDTATTDRPRATKMHSYPSQSLTGTTTTPTQSSAMETSAATSPTATSEMSELPKSTRVKGRTHPVSHGTSTTDRLGETTMHRYPTQSVTGTRTISMQSSSVDTSAATPSTTESAFTGAKASKKETVSVTGSSHDTVTTDSPSVTTMHRYPSQSVTGTRTISMESSSVETSAATPSTRKSGMSELPKSTRVKGRTHPVSHGTSTTDRLGETTMHRYPTQSVTGTRTISMQSSSVDTSAATPSTTESAFTGAKASKKETVSVTGSSHDTVTTDSPSVTTMHRYPSQSVTGTRTISMESSSVETSAATPSTRKSAFTESKTSKEEKVSETASSRDTVKTDRPSVTTMHSYPAQSVTGTTTTSTQSSVMETSQATSSTATSGMSELPKSTRVKGRTHPVSHGTSTTDRLGETTMHRYPTQSVTGTRTISMQSSSVDTSEATPSTTESAFTELKASKEETVSVTASSHDTVTTDRPSVTTMHRYPTQSVTGTRTISTESSSVETSAATPSTRKSAFTEAKASKEETVSVTASSHDTVTKDSPSVTTMDRYPTESVTAFTESKASTEERTTIVPSHDSVTTYWTSVTKVHSYPTQSVTGTATISTQSSFMKTSAASSSTAKSGSSFSTKLEKSSQNISPKQEVMTTLLPSHQTPTHFQGSTAEITANISDTASRSSDKTLSAVTLTLKQTESSASSNYKITSITSTQLGVSTPDATPKESKTDVSVDSFGSTVALAATGSQVSYGKTTKAVISTMSKSGSALTENDKETEPKTTRLLETNPKISQTMYTTYVSEDRFGITITTPTFEMNSDKTTAAASQTVKKAEPGASSVDENTNMQATRLPLTTLTSTVLPKETATYTSGYRQRSTTPKTVATPAESASSSQPGKTQSRTTQLPATSLEVSFKETTTHVTGHGIESTTRSSTPVTSSQMSSGMTHTAISSMKQIGIVTTSETTDSYKSTTNTAKHLTTIFVQRSSSTFIDDLKTENTQPSSYTKETPVSQPAKPTDTTDSNSVTQTSQTLTKPLQTVKSLSESQTTSSVPVGMTSRIPEIISPHTVPPGQTKTSATADSDKSTTRTAKQQTTAAIGKSSSTSKDDLETEKTPSLPYSIETPVSQPGSLTDIAASSQETLTSQTLTTRLPTFTSLSASQTASSLPSVKTSRIPETISTHTGQTKTSATGDSNKSTTRAAKHPITSAVGKISSTSTNGLETEKTQSSPYTLETLMSQPASPTDMTASSKAMQTSQTWTTPLQTAISLPVSQTSSVPLEMTSRIPETVPLHTGLHSQTALTGDNLREGGLENMNAQITTSGAPDNGQIKTSTAKQSTTATIGKSSSTPKEETEETRSFTETSASTIDITDSSKSILTSPTSVPHLPNRSEKQSTQATIGSGRSTTSDAGSPVTSSVAKFSSTPKPDLETKKSESLPYRKETPVSELEKATDITDSSQAIQTFQTSATPLASVPSVSTFKRSSPVAVGKTSGIPETTTANTDRSVKKETTPATSGLDRSTTSAAEHPSTSSIGKSSSTPKTDLETEKTKSLPYTKETPVSKPAKATDITDSSQAIHTSQTSATPLPSVAPVSTSQRSSPVPVGKTSGIPETTSAHTDRLGKETTPATITLDRSTTSAAEHPMTSVVGKSSSTPKTDLETEKKQPSSYTKETTVSKPAKATDIKDSSQGIQPSLTSAKHLPNRSGKESTPATIDSDRSTTSAAEHPITPSVGKSSSTPKTETQPSYYTKETSVSQSTKATDITDLSQAMQTSQTSETPLSDRPRKESTPATIYLDRSTTSAADHPITSSVGKSSSTPKADLETDKTELSSYTKETPVSQPAKATDITDSSQAIQTSQTSMTPLSDRSGRESTPATIDSDRSTTSAAEHPITPSVGKSSSTPKTDLETDKTQPSSFTKETPVSQSTKATDITDWSQAMQTSQTSETPLSTEKESTPATIYLDRSTISAAERPITSSVGKSSSTPKADLETDKTELSSYTKETPVSQPAKATDITDSSQAIQTSQTSETPLSGVTPASTSQRPSPFPVGKTSGIPETTSARTDRSGKESTPATIDSDRSTTSAAEHPITPSVGKSSSTPKTDLETDKTQASSYTKETPVSQPTKATDITDLSQAIQTSQTSETPLSDRPRKESTPATITLDRSTTSAAEHPTTSSVGKSSSTPKEELETDETELSSYTKETPVSQPAKATDITDSSQAIQTSQTSTTPLPSVTPVSTSQRSSSVPVGKTSEMPGTTSARTDRSGRESTPATIGLDRSTTSASEHPMTSPVRKSSSMPKTDLESEKTQPSSYTKETPVSQPAKATYITDSSQAIQTSQTSATPLASLPSVSTSQRSSPVSVAKTSAIQGTTSPHTDRSGKESTPATIGLDRSTTSAAEHPMTSPVGKSSSTPKADLETEKTQPSSYTEETTVSKPAKATDITDSSQAIQTSPTSVTPLPSVMSVSTSLRPSRFPIGKTSGTQETIPHTERSGKESTPATTGLDRSTTSAAEHPITSSVGKSSSTPKADLETDKTQPSSYRKVTPVSQPGKVTDITDSSKAIHTSQTSATPLPSVPSVSASQRSLPVPVGKTSSIRETTSPHTDRSGKESTPATIGLDRSTTSAAEHPITSSVGKSSSTPKADLETDKTQPSSYTKETPVSKPAKATDITDLSKAIQTSQTSATPLASVTSVSTSQRSSPVPEGETSGIPEPSSLHTGQQTTPGKADPDQTIISAATLPTTSIVSESSSTSIHISPTSATPLPSVTPISASQRSSAAPVGETSGIPETTSPHTGRPEKQSTPAAMVSGQSTTIAVEHTTTTAVGKSSSTPKLDLETENTQSLPYTTETTVSQPAKATDITDSSKAIQTPQTSATSLPKGSGKETTPITISLGRSTTSTGQHLTSSSVVKSSSTPNADLETEKTKSLTYTKATTVSQPAKATDITDSSKAIQTPQTSAIPLPSVTSASTSLRTSNVPVGKTSGIPETTSPLTDRAGKETMSATIGLDRSTTSAAEHPTTPAVEKSSPTPKADLETEKTQLSSYTKETTVYIRKRDDTSNNWFRSKHNKRRGTPNYILCREILSTPKTDLQTDRTQPSSYTKETTVSQPSKATDITDSAQGIGPSQTSMTPLPSLTSGSTSQRSSPVSEGKTSGIPETTSPHSDRSGKETTSATIGLDQSTTNAAEHPTTSPVGKSSSTPKADLQTDRTQPSSYTKETTVSQPSKATDITDSSQAIKPSQTSVNPLPSVTSGSTSQRSSPVLEGKTSGIPETTPHTDRSGRESTPATIGLHRSTTSAAKHPFTSSIGKSSFTPKDELETDKTELSSYTDEIPASQPAKATDITETSQDIQPSLTSTTHLPNLSSGSSSQRSSYVPVGKTSGIPDTSSLHTDRSGKETTSATFGLDRSTTSAAEHPTTSPVWKSSSTPKADLQTDRTQPSSYTKETTVSQPSKATDITDSSQAIKPSQTSVNPLPSVTSGSTSQRSSPVPEGKTSGIPETTSHTGRSEKESTPATIDLDRSTTSASEHPFTSSVGKSSSMPKEELETDETELSSYTKERPVSQPAKATDITDTSQDIQPSLTSTTPLPNLSSGSSSQISSSVPVGKTSGIPEPSSLHTDRSGKESTSATIDLDRGTTSAAEHTITSSVGKSSSTPKADLPTDKTQPSSYTMETTVSQPSKATDITDSSQAIKPSQMSVTHSPSVTSGSTSERSSPVPEGKTSEIPETTPPHTDESGKESTLASIYLDRSTTSAAEHPITSSVGKSSSTPKADLETDKTELSSYTKETPVSQPAKATAITDSSKVIHTSPTSVTYLPSVTSSSSSQRSLPVPVWKTSGIPETPSPQTGKETTQATIYLDRSTTSEAEHPTTSLVGKSSPTPKANLETGKTQSLSYTKETPVSQPAKATDITDSSKAIQTSQTSATPLSSQSGKQSISPTIGLGRSTTRAAEHPTTSAEGKFSFTPKADLETQKTHSLPYTEETPVSQSAKTTGITDPPRAIQTSQKTATPLPSVTSVSSFQRSSPVPEGETSGIPEPSSLHTGKSGKQSISPTIGLGRSTSVTEHLTRATVQKSSSTPEADLETEKTQLLSHTEETPVSQPSKATDITDSSKAILTSPTSATPLPMPSGQRETSETADLNTGTTTAAKPPTTAAIAKSSSTLKDDLRTDKTQSSPYTKQTPLSQRARSTDIRDSTPATHTSQNLARVSPSDSSVSPSETYPAPVVKTSRIREISEPSRQPTKHGTAGSGKTTTMEVKQLTSATISKKDPGTEKSQSSPLQIETLLSGPAIYTVITHSSPALPTSLKLATPLPHFTSVPASETIPSVPIGKTSSISETIFLHTDRSGEESTPTTIYSDRSTTGAGEHPITSSVGKSSSTPKADLQTDKTLPLSYTKETPVSTPAKAKDITDLSQGIHTAQTSSAPLSDRSGKESTPATIDSDRSTTSAADHPITSSVGKSSSTSKADLETDKSQPLSYTKETPVTTPAKATDITDLSQGIHTSQTSTTPLPGVTPVSTSQRSSPVPDGKTSGMPETTSFRTNRSGKESTPATIDSDRSTTSAADHPITSSVGKSSSTPKADLETDKTQPSSYTKETPISKPAKATDITDSSRGINTSPTSTAPYRSGKESTPATIDSDRSTTSAADHPITSSVGKSSSTPKADLETDKTLPLSYTKETPVSTPAKAKDITDLSQGIHTSQTSSAPLSGVTPVSTSLRSSPVPDGKTSGMPETTSDHTGKESTPATIDSDRSTTSAADHPMTSSVGKSSSTPKTDLETDKTQPSTYTKETPISTPAKATDITDLSKEFTLPRHRRHLYRSGKESTPATIDSDRSTTSAADHPITSSVGKSSSTSKADLETDKSQPLSYTKETPVTTPAKATDITDLSQGIHTSKTSTTPLSGVTPVSISQRSSPVPDGKTSGMPETTSDHTNRSGKESTPATIDSDRSTTSAADHPITSSVGKSSSTPKADLETDKTQPSSYTKETPISKPAKATDITDSSQGINTSPTSTAPLSGVTLVSATQRSPVPVEKTSGIPQPTSALTDHHLFQMEKPPECQKLLLITLHNKRSGPSNDILCWKIFIHAETDLETDKTQPQPTQRKRLYLHPQRPQTSQTCPKDSHFPDIDGTFVRCDACLCYPRSSPVPVGKTSRIPQTTSALTDRSGKESTPATIDSDRSTTGAAEHLITSSVEKSSSTPKADLETDKTQASSHTKETPVSTPAKAIDITDLSKAIHTSTTSTTPLSGVTLVSISQRSSPDPVGKTSGIPQTTSARTDRSGKESTPATIDSDRSTTSAADHPITSSVGKSSSTSKADLETDKSQPLSYTKETPVTTPAKATDITDLSQGIHTSKTSTTPLSDRSGKESTPATIDSDRSTTSAADHPITSSVGKSSSTPKADLETDKTQPSSYTKETPISKPAKATDITDSSQGINTSPTSTAPLSGVTLVSATQRSPVPVEKTSGIPQPTSALTIDQEKSRHQQQLTRIEAQQAQRTIHYIICREIFIHAESRFRDG